MNDRKSLLIVALASFLISGSAARALDCPPGQTEVSGKCVPFTPFAKEREKSVHYESEAKPGFGLHELWNSGNGGAKAPTGGAVSSPPAATAAPATANAPAKAAPKAIPKAAASAIEKSLVPAISESQKVPQLVPVRAYLKSADIPPPSIGAYGIVAFRAKPTSASRSRLLMACKSYVASIPPQKSVPDTVPVSDQMLTIWPLENPASPSADKDDCDYALDNYGLYAADSAISDAAKQGAKFGTDGPFLIGWSPSNTRGVADKLVLVVDMSLYSSQDSFDHAFLFWKQKIVEDPALWRPGFSVEAVRLAVRDFANEYGDTILQAAVSVWKK